MRNSSKKSFFPQNPFRIAHENCQGMIFASIRCWEVGGWVFLSLSIQGLGLSGTVCWSSGPLGLDSVGAIGWSMIVTPLHRFAAKVLSGCDFTCNLVTPLEGEFEDLEGCQEEENNISGQSLPQSRGKLPKLAETSLECTKCRTICPRLRLRFSDAGKSGKWFFCPKSLSPSGSLRFLIEKENCKQSQGLLQLFRRRPSPLRSGWRQGMLNGLRQKNRCDFWCSQDQSGANFLPSSCLRFGTFIRRATTPPSATKKSVWSPKSSCYFTTRFRTQPPYSLCISRRLL